MKYKALMLDIDGTLIPYDYEASPSPRVAEAVRKAREILTVCIVTGRSYRSTRRLLEELGISDGYAVVDGGAIIMDVSTHTPIYQNFISDEDVQKVLEVFNEENADLFIKDEKSRNHLRDHYDPYVKGQKYENVSQFFTQETFTLEDTHRIMKKLSIPTLEIFRTRHKDPTLYGLNISNVSASKLHGVVEVSKKIGVKKEEIIGVGDGYNDFPLLESCGFKVAMGNALDDLKAVADYVAPSVDEDGVADVIEKFIL